LQVRMWVELGTRRGAKRERRTRDASDGQ
jgi:hypothetical protein